MFRFSVTDDLKNLVIKLENRVSQLEKGKGGSAPAPAKVEEEEDDDDVDLFGSDSEDEEAKAEKVNKNHNSYKIIKKSGLLDYHKDTIQKIQFLFNFRNG